MEMHTAIGNGPGEPPDWDTLAPRVQCRPAKQGQDRRKLVGGAVLLLEIGYYDETIILYNSNTVWLHCDTDYHRHLHQYRILLGCSP